MSPGNAFSESRGAEEPSIKGQLCVGSSPLAIVPRILHEIRGRRVLDVGCGCGVYGYLLRNKWQDTYPGLSQFRNFGLRDVRNDQPELLVGVDIQTENIRRCDYHRIYDYLALCSADSLPFAENQFDTVLCIEVLEHLEKAASLRALQRLEQLAAQRVIITVPEQAVDPHSGKDERGFLKVDATDPDVREWVEAETHKCSYTRAELQALGYRTSRPVRHSWRGLLDIARNAYDRFGPPRGQILAIKALRKSASRNGDFQPPAAPKTTVGFPDFR